MLRTTLVVDLPVKLEICFLHEASKILLICKYNTERLGVLNTTGGLPTPCLYGGLPTRLLVWGAAYAPACMAGAAHARVCMGGGCLRPYVYGGLSTPVCVWGGSTNVVELYIFRKTFLQFHREVVYNLVYPLPPNDQGPE